MGRIGYMKLDGRADAVTLFGWTLPWDTDFLALGAALFSHSLAALQTHGIQIVQRELYDSWGTLEQQRQALQTAGFNLRQAQHVYEYAADAGRVSSATSLRFESLASVGDEQMMAVMAQIIVDTPDQNIQDLIARDGLASFVAQDYAMLKREYDVDPAWWCLAYAPDGSLVGIFQSVKFKPYNEGNVAFIGVLSTQRGEGYGYALLAEATNRLLDAGLDLVNGRTDAQNIPMQRTFAKAGYQLASQVWTYETRLETS